MNASFFGELLQTISERGRALIDRARERRGVDSTRSESLIELAEHLLVRPRRGLRRRARARNPRPLCRTHHRPAHRLFRGAGRALRARSRAHGSGHRRLARQALRRNRGGSARRLRAAPAGVVPPAQSRARRHRRAGAHARAVDGRARTPRRRSRRRSTPTSSICSRPGSTAASWCCAASTGRRRRSCWRRSSATRRCTKSAAGTTCAGASIRPTGAATPSSIRRWWTIR